MTRELREIPLTQSRYATLFEAAGGEAGLEQILLKFYRKMREDLLVGFFYKGREIETIARKQTNFVMKAWGLKKEYAGKLPKDAHGSMPPILKGHFDRRLVLLAETLRENGIAENLVQIWIDFEGRFRGAVQARE